MRKYLLAVLAIIAGTIISAKTAEVALDAHGNTAKILILGRLYHRRMTICVVGPDYFRF
jgi:hypothetical protein